MATLKTKARKKSATFTTKGKARFPMPDKAHARNALARLNQAKNITPSQKAKVKARARKILGKKK